MGLGLVELEVGVEEGEPGGEVGELAVAVEEGADEDAVLVELKVGVSGVEVVVLDALEVLAAAELCEALARKQP